MQTRAQKSENGKPMAKALNTNRSGRKLNKAEPETATTVVTSGEEEPISPKQRNDLIQITPNKKKKGIVPTSSPNRKKKGIVPSIPNKKKKGIVSTSSPCKRHYTLISSSPSKRQATDAPRIEPATMGQRKETSLATVYNNLTSDEDVEIVVVPVLGHGSTIKNILEWAASGTTWRVEDGFVNFEDLDIELPPDNLDLLDLMSQEFRDLASLYQAVENAYRQHRGRPLLFVYDTIITIETESQKSFPIRALLQICWIANGMIDIRWKRDENNEWQLQVVMLDLTSGVIINNLSVGESQERNRIFSDRLLGYQKFHHDKFLKGIGRKPVPYAYLVNWHPKFNHFSAFVFAHPPPSLPSYAASPNSPLIHGDKQTAMMTPERHNKPFGVGNGKLSKFPLTGPPTPQFSSPPRTLTPIKTRPIVSPQTPNQQNPISPMTPQMARLIEKAKGAEARKKLAKEKEISLQDLSQLVQLREDCVRVFESLVTHFLRSDRQPFMELDKLANKIARADVGSYRVWDEERILAALIELAGRCEDLISIKPGKSEPETRILHYNRKAQQSIKDYKMELVGLSQQASHELEEKKLNLLD